MCGADVNLALTGNISEENGCSAGTNSSKSLLRGLQWNEVPEPLRKEVLLMLSVSDTVKLDTAIAARQEREELVRAYKGLRSQGFNGHEHYTDADGYASLMWARERKIDLAGGHKGNEQALPYLQTKQRDVMSSSISSCSPRMSAKVSMMIPKTTFIRMIMTTTENIKW